MQQFFPGILLAASIAFDHHKPFMLNFFVGGVTILTAQAFPAAANDRSFPR
jgi:hypothetical protein